MIAPVDPAGPLPEHFDALILGGALSGAATALQLLEQAPHLRVGIVERSPVFERRVGESTVEVSAYFLGRVLGLTQHLNECHLHKQGLRFIFANADSTNLGDCSELGPKYLPRLPGYQVDRAVLDEEVLRKAVAAGAILLRPAQALGYAREPAGGFSVPVREAAGERTLTTRWLVDATGVRALVARQEGWWQTNADHPTASVWTRWQGIKALDSQEFRQRYPQWSARCFGTRFTGTNHLLGRGWWSWWIPLRNGDMSVGIVFDQRLIDLPPGPSVGARLRAFLVDQHPAARELLADATWIEGDVHLRRNLAYRCRTVAQDGVLLVGDAAGFIDPFYSPGMDWIAYTSASAAHVVAQERAGVASGADLAAQYDRKFQQSYERWFEALYRDKYHYMGDFELMSLAFRLDLGLYYLGVASQPYRYGNSALLRPSFGDRTSTLPFGLIRLYHQRLVRIAQERHRRGTWGRHNTGHFFPFNSYRFHWVLPLRVLKALAAWGWLEVREGWRSWGRAAPVTPPMAASVPVRSGL